METQTYMFAIAISGIGLMGFVSIIGSELKKIRKLLEKKFA